ncbi:hypothetical protein KJA15_03520 [Patescibacteria group bacterium]|nr:hypothetical protein [Patescibacteria group bacterium]
MAYKKIHLITNEFFLKESVNRFVKIKSDFSNDEIKYPNFGHYPKPPEDQSLRVKIEFSNEEIEQKALKTVKQLVGDGYINDFTPNRWVERNPSENVKSAITLSSECAVKLSKLDEFEKICQSNLLPKPFSLCFFNELFDVIEISLGFEKKVINTIMKKHGLTSIINHSVDAVESTIKPFKSQFSNRRFFERFIHILDNDLLIFPEVEYPEFWKPFYEKNKLNSESFIDTLERFCSEFKK